MRAQGATEYLLILAAVLVVVAVAVYYVTRAPGAPTIIVRVALKPADNTVWVRGETGCSTLATWTFYYKGGDITDWQGPITGKIGPGEEVQLEALTNHVKLGDTVTLKWDTTVKDYTVTQY
ncbi:MAG: class III signal peptide-containing protein [Candidatus Hadarchaeales archaeon]